MSGRRLSRSLLGPALSSGGAEHAVVHANKLLHTFDFAKHWLDDLVGKMGSQESAYQAIQEAAQADVEVEGKTGLFEVVVDVAGTTVTVTGNVIDGLDRIGMAGVR